MPNAYLVTKWSVQWASSISVHQVRKAFDLCGLVPAPEFKVENLHQPLRDVFERNYSVQEWIKLHGQVIASSQIEVGPGWRCFEGKNSFFVTMYELTTQETEFKVWKPMFAAEMIDFLKDDDTSKPLFTDNDKFIIECGKRITKGFFEFYAASNILRRNLHVITFDADESSKDRVVEPTLI